MRVLSYKTLFSQVFAFHSIKSIGMNAVAHCFLLWIGATALIIGVWAQDDDNSKFAEQYSKASCNFTLNILKYVIKNYNSSNIIFSPASISILLSVLQQGAKENTAAQLEKVVHLSPEQSLKAYQLSSLTEEENVTLEWGNRCYIKPGLKLEDDFQKNIKENLDVDVEELDFGTPSPMAAAEKINDWVKKTTHEQISDLVDPSLLSPETIMVLINAIFFKGTWMSPFKKGKTAEDKFELSSDKSVRVPFMYQREKFYSDKNTFLGAKWIQLPFQNNRFMMIFILPTKKHRLNQLAEKLTDEDLFGIFSHRGISRVKIRIPKFKLSEKVSLTETLKALGLTDIFSGDSNLEGISATENLQVSEIIHQANVEIDEKGSTGSAATVITFLRMRTPNLAFIADHPFLFFIIDQEKKIPLFAGKVANPKT